MEKRDDDGRKQRVLPCRLANPPIHGGSTSTMSIPVICTHNQKTRSECWLELLLQYQNNYHCNALSENMKLNK